MGEPTIITNNLESTFRALRHSNPMDVVKQNVPEHPDYKRIPSRNYAPIATTSSNWGDGYSITRTASTVYGQPQFFSPVHTPINWQIPSKRLEQYQWCLTPWSKICTEDFTYIEIQDIKIGDKVLTKDGNIKEVEKIGIRHVNEDINVIEIQSENDPIEITGNHNIYFVKKEDIACKYKINNKSPQKCTPLYGVECSTYKNKSHSCGIDKLIITKAPSDELRENDYMLFPIPKLNKENGDMTIGKARLLGYYTAEGDCYINTLKSMYQVKFTLNIDERDNIAKEICQLLKEEFNEDPYLYVWDKRPNTLVVKVQSKVAIEFFQKYCPGTATNKKFSSDILSLDFELQKHIIATYISGDGHFKYKKDKLTEVSMCSASKDLLDQIRIMLSTANITTGKITNRTNKLTYNGITKYFDCYGLSMSASSISKFGDIFVDKTIPVVDFNSKNNNVVIDGYILKRVKKITKRNYDGAVYNIEVKDDHSYVVNGCAVSNCRFFYENEPKVASAIDFYSSFPMSNWTHECSNLKVKKYFDNFKSRLQLAEKSRLISHEVHLLGDCFPMTEISCPLCNGSGRNGDEICEHEGGTISRVTILNPDYMDIYTSPLSPEPVLALRPDEELITMVAKKMPGYERLSPEVIKLITSGQPIRLDNRSISHLKYGASGYRTWGTGMIRRLFPILSYKTKLMVAQWIVAERLILPIKIVKVGSDERPAGPADIAAVQSQLAQTANDPNLTIVTHHNFELDFIGACHDDKTEVLTKNGWKLFKDTTMQDEIGTYNLNTMELEYQLPIDKQEYDYDGKMYLFNSKQVDVCVTPNHMMLTSKINKNNADKIEYQDWTKVRADEIKNNDRFISQIKWSGVVPDCLPYKDSAFKNFNLDTYLKFFGYYISDRKMKTFKDDINTIDYDTTVARIEDFSNELMGTDKNKSIKKWILNLPCDKLNILFNSIFNNKSKKLTYNTDSKQLSEDIYEIAMKLGYNVSVIENNNRYTVKTSFENKYQTIKRKNISKIDYSGKVFCFTVPNGYIITRRNGKIGIHGNSGKVLTLSTEFEFINQEILDGLMINNALLNGEGPTFASASVGIEAMYQRLDTFRSYISEWLINSIYKPEAKRQGFIDEDSDPENPEYIVPTIKWNKMQLRDQQQDKTFAIQLYEKGLLSAQTLLEIFGYNPDMEIERKRYDAVQMMALGQGFGGGQQEGGAGGGMGGMGGGGGGGGMGGLDLGGIGGGDMGGGGEPPISAPGGDQGGAPLAQTSTFVAEVAQPENYGGKILRKKTRDKIDNSKHNMTSNAPKGLQGHNGEQRDEKGRIIFTKPERELMDILIKSQQDGLLKYEIIPQFRVAVGNMEYPLDFAIPKLQIGIEADGEMFHSSPAQVQKDKARDMKLNQQGWTIIRFKDSEIENKGPQIASTVLKTIMQKEISIKKFISNTKNQE